MSDPRPVRVRVSRSKPGGATEERHFDEFELRPEPADTVLDALLEIRRLDPSLVVRHSCMRGSCGACGVRVDGREVLACDTRLPSGRRRPVTIEPLSGQRPIADLAVDMVDFQARLTEVGLPLVRRLEPGLVEETRRDGRGPFGGHRQPPEAAEPPEGVRSFSRFEDCIECGLCLAACPVASADRRYLGPAALAAAERLVEEPRGRELGPVLALAAEPDSVWRCRDVMECTAVCPAAVEPGTSVISLRRRLAGQAARRVFRRDR